MHKVRPVSSSSIQMSAHAMVVPSLTVGDVSDVRLTLDVSHSRPQQGSNRLNSVMFCSTGTIGRCDCRQVQGQLHHRQASLQAAGDHMAVRVP